MKLDDCDSEALIFFVVVGFSGSRVSVLDFNKSTQPFTNLIQIVTYVYYNKKLREFFILFLVLKFKYSIVILGLSELNIYILEFTCHDELSIVISLVE